MTNFLPPRQPRTCSETIYSSHVRPMEWAEAQAPSLQFLHILRERRARDKEYRNCSVVLPLIRHSNDKESRQVPEIALSIPSSHSPIPAVHETMLSFDPNTDVLRSLVYIWI